MNVKQQCSDVATHLPAGFQGIFKSAATKPGHSDNHGDCTCFGTQNRFIRAAKVDYHITTTQYRAPARQAIALFLASQRILPHLATTQSDSEHQVAGERWQVKAIEQHKFNYLVATQAHNQTTRVVMLKTRYGVADAQTELNMLIEVIKQHKQD